MWYQETGLCVDKQLLRVGADASVEKRLPRQEDSESRPSLVCLLLDFRVQSPRGDFPGRPFPIPGT